MKKKTRNMLQIGLFQSEKLLVIESNILDKIFPKHYKRNQTEVLKSDSQKLL